MCGKDHLDSHRRQIFELRQGKYFFDRYSYSAADTIAYVGTQAGYAGPREAGVCEVNTLRVSRAFVFFMVVSIIVMLLIGAVVAVLVFANGIRETFIAFAVNTVLNFLIFSVTVKVVTFMCVVFSVC